MKLATLTLAAAALVAAPAYAALDNAQAEAMMKKDGCAACHAVDKKIVGPAYVDVAAKYKGDKNAQATLEKKVKDGGVGIWGPDPDAAQRAGAGERHQGARHLDPRAQEVAARWSTEGAPAVEHRDGPIQRPRGHDGARRDAASPFVI